ncbi:MAG TPA: hypothetical protein P5050_09415 [Bacteroidia bacterium]|nr:hypothetical protein [Bacteroidia bacterium]HRS59426.1 hypothetical protein [Bacteroidia bacterium]HRU68633.1 hypothetical protein [Bacteroidia bacterium]
MINRVQFFLTLLFLLFLNAFFLRVNGQDYVNPIGSRSRGLADASVSFSDPWSSFNNQAGLALLRKPAIGVFAENKFNIKELNGGAFTLNIPVQNQGTFAFDFYIFNYSVIFSRQKIGLAYASKLARQFYAGIQLNYLRTTTENYQVRNTLFGEAGLMYRPTETVTLGVHIFNPTVARYDKYSNEKVPVVVNFGGIYQLAQKASLHAEFEHSSHYGYGWKGGVEYSVNQYFKLRAGFRNNPVVTTFGLNLAVAGFNIDIAFQIHQILGYSPSFSADKMFDKIH